MKFKFEMGQKVKLAMSSETGEVIGRAEYANHGNQYTVRYVAADGRQCQVWFDEDAIVAQE